MAKGPEMAPETEMPPFPKTYDIVRGGSCETVTVGDVEALLELRTELELVLQLGADATPELVSVLDARLAQLASQPTKQAATEYDNVADMRSILSDAQASANRLAVASIDTDSPDVKGVLNMSAIEKESEAFQQEVAEMIGDEPVEDADALAKAFADAVDAEAAADEAASADEVTQAAGPESAIESEETVVGEQQVETVADALGELAAEAKNELDAIANGFEQAADELADLTQTMQEADDAVESPTSPSQDSNDDRVAEAPGIAESEDGDAGTGTDVDDAFEALARECETCLTDESDSNAETLEQVEQEAFDPFAASEADVANGQAQAFGVVAPSETVTVPVAPTFSAGVPSSQDSGSLRGQLEEIKRSLIFQIDRLTEVLDKTSHIQTQMHATASQAARFKQAADGAQEASLQLTAARTDADRARSTYEQAENRVAEARREWEAAQREATEAAKQVAVGT